MFPLRIWSSLEKTSLRQLRTDPWASPLGLSRAALRMSFPDSPSPGGGGGIFHDQVDGEGHGHSHDHNHHHYFDVCGL